MGEPIERSLSRRRFDRFLAELEAGLDLPATERADVRDEIRAHLEEAHAEAIAAGASAENAASAALGRLGDPRVLARELSRARHARARLLAAAGAGTLSAAGGAVRGFVLGAALLTTVLSAAAVVMAMAYRAGAIGSFRMADAGWFTAMLAVGSWFAAWHAGRSLVPTLAVRSHRRAERVRPFAALLGGLLVAWLSLGWLQAPQNLVSVSALALVPVVFVVAAATGSDDELVRSRAARRASLALFATVVVSVPLLLLAAGAPVDQRASAVGFGPYDSMGELLEAQGLDMPGRFVPDPPALEAGEWRFDRGVVRVELGNAPVLAERWTDLRLEAWRSELSTGRLERSSPRPFVTAPLSPTDRGTFVGSVRVDRTRDVSGFAVVVTGTAQDGVRDLVVTLGASNTTFSGSVVDWLVGS